MKLDKKVRILALDPGSTNFAFSVIELDTNAKPRIVKCGMIGRQHLLHDLKPWDLTPTRNKFIRKIEWLMGNARADAIVAERYTSRIRGISGEYINIMLGWLTEYAFQTIPDTKLRLFMSVTWKSRLKKFMDIEKFYAQSSYVADHQIDATLIGLFYAESEYGINLERTVGTKAGLKRLTANIVDVTMSPRLVKDQKERLRRLKEKK